jgi:hypothetical protein
MPSIESIQFVTGCPCVGAFCFFAYMQTKAPSSHSGPDARHHFGSLALTCHLLSLLPCLKVRVPIHVRFPVMMAVGFLISRILLDSLDPLLLSLNPRHLPMRMMLIPLGF